MGSRKRALETDGDEAEQSQVKESTDEPSTSKRKASISTAGNAVASTSNTGQNGSRSKRSNGPVATNTEESTRIFTAPLASEPVDAEAFQRAIKGSGSWLEAKRRRLAMSPAPPSAARKSVSALEILLGSTSNSRSGSHGSATPQPSSSQAAPSPTASSSRPAHTRPVVSVPSTSRSPVHAGSRSSRPKATTMPVKKGRQAPSRKGKERAQSTDSEDSDSASQASSQGASDTRATNVARQSRPSKPLPKTAKPVRIRDSPQLSKKRAPVPAEPSEVVGSRLGRKRRQAVPEVRTAVGDAPDKDDRLSGDHTLEQQVIESGSTESATGQLSADLEAILDPNSHPSGLEEPTEKLKTKKRKSRKSTIDQPLNAEHAALADITAAIQSDSGSTSKSPKKERRKHGSPRPAAPSGTSVPTPAFYGLSKKVHSHAQPIPLEPDHQAVTVRPPSPASTETVIKLQKSERHPESLDDQNASRRARKAEKKRLKQIKRAAKEAAKEAESVETVNAGELAKDAPAAIGEQQAAAETTGEQPETTVKAQKAASKQERRAAKRAAARREAEAEKQKAAAEVAEEAAAEASTTLGAQADVRGRAKAKAKVEAAKAEAAKAEAEARAAVRAEEDAARLAAQAAQEAAVIAAKRASAASKAAKEAIRKVKQVDQEAQTKADEESKIMRDLPAKDGQTCAESELSTSTRQTKRQRKRARKEAESMALQRGIQLSAPAIAPLALEAQTITAPETLAARCRQQPSAEATISPAPEAIPQTVSRMRTGNPVKRHPQGQDLKQSVATETGNEPDAVPQAIIAEIAQEEGGGKEDDLTERERRKAAKKAAKRKEKKERKAAAEAEAQLAQQIVREEFDMPNALPSAADDQIPSLTGSDAVERATGEIAPVREDLRMLTALGDASQRPSSKAELRAVQNVLLASEKRTLQSEQADEESDSIRDFTGEDTGTVLPARELLLDELSDTDATAFVMRDYFASDSSDWEEQQYETKIRVVKPVTPRRPAVKSTSTRQSSRARRSVSYFSDGDFEAPAAAPARSLRKRVDGKALTAVASARKARSASDTEDDGGGVSGIDSPSSSKTHRTAKASQAVAADSDNESSSENDAEDGKEQVAATSSLLVLASQTSEPSSVSRIDDSRMLLDSPSPSPEPQALRDSHAVLPVTSPIRSMPPSEQTSVTGDSPSSVAASATVEVEQRLQTDVTREPAKSATAPVRPRSALDALLARMDTGSGNDSSSSDGAYTTDGDLSEPEKDERPRRFSALLSRPSRPVRRASTSSSEPDSADENESGPGRSAAAAPTIVTTGPSINSARQDDEIEESTSPPIMAGPVEDAHALRAASIGLDEAPDVATDASTSQANEASTKLSKADTEQASSQVQDEVTHSSQEDRPALEVPNAGSPVPPPGPSDAGSPAPALSAPDTQSQALSPASPRQGQASTGMPQDSQPSEQPEVRLNTSADSASDTGSLQLSGQVLEEVAAQRPLLVPDRSAKETSSAAVLPDLAIADVSETVAASPSVAETFTSHVQDVDMVGSPSRLSILPSNNQSIDDELRSAHLPVSPERLSSSPKHTFNPPDVSPLDVQGADATSFAQSKNIPTLSEISMAESPEKERFSSPDSPGISPGASEGQEGAIAQAVHSSAATTIPDVSLTDITGASSDLSTEAAQQSAPAMAASASFDSLYSSSSSSAMSQELLDAIKGFVEEGERATPAQRPEGLSAVEGSTSVESEQKKQAAIGQAAEEQASQEQTSKDEVVEEHLSDESVQTNHKSQEQEGRTPTDIDIRRMIEPGEDGEEAAPMLATNPSPSAEPAATLHESAGASPTPEHAPVVDNVPGEAALREGNEVLQQHDMAGSGAIDAPQLVIDSPSPQKSSTVHSEVALVPDTPRRSARIASRSPSPSLDRASHVAASPSMKLYPSLAGLTAALITVDEEARSDIGDAESAAHPDIRSESLPDQSGAEETQETEQDVDTNTASRPHRFADMPASPPSLLTGFDTQSQIDQLGSQPVSASPIMETSRTIRGSSESSQSTGAASSLPFQENSQVAQLREDTSMSSLPSPAASGNVSEQEVELSLINKKMPLFAPENPSASLESANGVDSKLDLPSDSDDAQEVPETNGHTRQVSSSTQDSADVAPFMLSASPESASGANKTHSESAAASQRGRGQAHYPASNVRSSNTIEDRPETEPRRSTYQLQPPNPNPAVVFRSRVASQPTRPHATGEIPTFGIQPVSAHKSQPNKNSGRLAASSSTPNLSRNTSTPVTRASGFVAKPLSALASMATRPTRSSSRFSFSSAAVPAQSAAKKPLRRSEESDEEDSTSSSASEGEKDGSSKSQIPLGQRAGASKRSVSSKTKRGSLGAFASQK